MLLCSRWHLSRCFLLLLINLVIPANSRSEVNKKPRDAHPIVPGFERFYADSGADAVKGGRLLLGELNCFSCHKSEAGQETALPPKQAPILDGIGGRLRRSYLRKFLRAPQTIKPGAAMPNLFAAVPEAELSAKIEALVHFLAATGTLEQERPDRRAIPLGKQLYHQVGCVACHGSRDQKGNAAKLLADSVPLGQLRSKYSIASLAAFLENPQAVRPSGRMPGILNGQEAKQVANYLLQGQSLGEMPANVAYSYYEGRWNKLPHFARLRPRATGKTCGFDLSVARRPGDFAVRYEGFLPIDRTGTYRFHLTSDDGSKVLLDDKPALANDGIHPPSTVSETVQLAKGIHKLAASVFNADGGVELRIEIEGPGLRRQDVAPLLMLTPQGNPKPTAKPVDPQEDDDFALKPELVQQGRELFASIGCANCHQLSTNAPPTSRKRPRREGPSLALPTHSDAGGCLAAAPLKGLPWYSLNAAQRRALTMALKSQAAKATTEEIITQTMTALSCYACHQRGKAGGVEAGINSFFVTTQPEMGEEGRLPPPLHDVGAKLRPDYLRHIFNQGAHDRPYMQTRMPRFGESNMPRLIEALAAADKGKAGSVAQVTFSEPVRSVKSAARKMCGSSSLGCIKCHTFAGHKAEGVQGLDMLMMPRRLQHDWFYRYLLDPQKLRPGTRMPTAWTNGMTVLPDVLGGSAAKQIESIWVYLQDGGKAGLPAGLRRQSIPLIPDKETIVYRNFLEGVGPRGIAVGYPEKASLSFDAHDLRLALIWQGDFLDAGRHWNDRSSGFEPPLGDNVVRLPSGVAFAVLAKEDDPWPNRSGKDLGYQFRGYRTTSDGRPTFLYTCCGTRIEDFPNAVAGAPSPSIRRVLTLVDDKPSGNLCFRAAVAEKIESIAKGTYRINDEWTLKLDCDAEARIRKSNGKMELMAPVRFHDGKARIVQEFVW